LAVFVSVHLRLLLGRASITLSPSGGEWRRLSFHENVESARRHCSIGGHDDAIE